jgi:hypothetical protein
MKPPYLLFLSDSQEVETYEDLAELLAGIESKDVQDGVYALYDSEGLHLELFVDDDEIPQAKPEGLDPEGARRKIIEFYGAENPRFTNDASLTELIVELHRIDGGAIGSR